MEKLKPYTPLQNTRTRADISLCLTIFSLHQRVTNFIPLQMLAKKNEVNVNDSCNNNCSRLNSAPYWDEQSTPRPSCFTPGKEPRYPLHRGLGEPKGPSGRVWRRLKFLASSGNLNPDCPGRNESLREDKLCVAVYFHWESKRAKDDSLALILWVG